jgi:hypothetical protein
VFNDTNAAVLRFIAGAPVELEFLMDSKSADMSFMPIPLTDPTKLPGEFAGGQEPPPG